MSRQTLHIKRAGPGINDWSLTFDDGSPVPPIASLVLELEAGKIPRLDVEVADAFTFESGGLSPAWKVSPETLSAMAEDQGLELVRLGALDEIETATEALYANASASIEAISKQAEAAETNRRDWQGRHDRLQRERNQEVGRLTTRLGEFRNRNIGLLKTNDELRCEVEHLREQDLAAQQEAATLRTLVENERAVSFVKEQQLEQAKAETAALRFELAEAKNRVQRERRAAELARMTLANKDFHTKQADSRNPPGQWSAECRADPYAVITRLQAQVDAGKLDQQIAIDAKAVARRYEEENHALKRRLANLPPVVSQGEAVLPLSTGRRSGEPCSVVIIAHDEAQRRTLSKGSGDYEVMTPGQCFAGHRFDVVIVAAIPEYLSDFRSSYSSRHRNNLDRLIAEEIPARLRQGGVLINLNGR